MIVGQQKGYNTKTRQYRNFGMANPEGYRKSITIDENEKFGIPVLTLIDTRAYPGLEAEERGQGEAIARNILRWFVPRCLLLLLVGEGASGGALGIGWRPRFMLVLGIRYFTRIMLSFYGKVGSTRNKLLKL
jgi:acetyl-CoA carboxylase carboxyl transferase subunit alpha